jgi:hypothetical protein
VPSVHCCYPRVCKIIPGTAPDSEGRRHGRCGLIGGAAFG